MNYQPLTLKLLKSKNCQKESDIIKKKVGNVPLTNDVLLKIIDGFTDIYEVNDFSIIDLADKLLTKKDLAVFNKELDEKMYKFNQKLTRMYTNYCQQVKKVGRTTAGEKSYDEDYLRASIGFSECQMIMFLKLYNP